MVFGPVAGSDYTMASRNSSSGGGSNSGGSSTIL